MLFKLSFQNKLLKKHKLKEEQQDKEQKDHIAWFYYYLNLKFLESMKVEDKSMLQIFTNI